MGRWILGAMVALPMLAAAEKAPPLLVVSLDGFRHDFVELPALPNVKRLKENGLHAEGLIPPFPAKTFVSHTTIATGLHPVHHGIVHNQMFDPVFGETFAINLYKARYNPKWWGGEPIWVTAEKQGLKAASLFWPGDDVKRRGMLPSYFLPYEQSMPHQKRVEQILQWLDLPEKERPSFLTLYFHDVDSAGQEHGIDSEGMRKALATIDATVGSLLNGLEERGLLDQINLVLLSDHGLCPVSKDRVILLDDYIDPTRARFVLTGPVAGLHLEPAEIEPTFKKLEEAHASMNVFRKGSLPEHLHYNEHDRIPDIVLLAEEGWLIETKSTLAKRDWDAFHAAHGYDSRLQSQHGIFIGHGPSFPAGTMADAFEAVHCYNLFCRLLGLEPAANDGDPGVAKRLLAAD